MGSNVMKYQVEIFIDQLRHSGDTTASFLCECGIAGNAIGKKPIPKEAKREVAVSAIMYALSKHLTNHESEK